MNAPRKLTGEPIDCQVRGCMEQAQPWSYLLDYDDDLVVEVYVCRRHEGALFGIETRVEKATSS